MDGRAYYYNTFGAPFSFLRGSWKQPSHVSVSYPYLNCANGRMTPVNVTYDQDVHILEACPTPPKVFRLNPDAKSFVPMHYLNPYAREFKPKCYEEENLRHKRSCSSIHSSEEDEVSSGDDSISPPPPHSKQMESLDKSPTIVISSLNGGDSSPKNESSNEKKICAKLKICSLRGDEKSMNEEINANDEEDSVSDDDDDDDDDWDDLEFESSHSSSTWEDLPDEFKDNFGLTCPLSQNPPSSNSNNSNTSRAKDFLLSADSDNEDSDEENEEDILREKELQERLASINKEWSKHYLKLPNHNVTSSCGVIKKNVSFSDENCWTVIEEDPEIAQELRESRTSDHLSRKADRERLEKIISPILDKDHRNKVYQRLCNSQVL